jgi:hypothetical protein
MFTQGGPACGTEMEFHALVNTTTAPRNLFFISGYVALVNMYNKTRHNTGKERIAPRFPAHEVIRYILYIVTLIRPAERFFAPEIFGPEAVTNYSTYLWVERGNTMATPQFTHILENVTETHLGIRIGISDWRHLAKTIFRHLLDIDLENDHRASGNPDALLQMFGHDELEVGEAVYGLEFNNLRDDFDDASFACWLQGSIKLHTFEQLFAPTAASSRWITKTIAPDLPKILAHMETILADTTQFRLLMDQTKTHLVESVDAVIPKLGEMIKTSISNSLPWKQCTEHHLASEVPKPTNPVLVHPSRLHALRLLYKQENVSFKSSEQAELLELICQQEHHIVGVLKTGGGKSLLFFGPAKIETGITVVITPLVALHDQHLNNARLFNIPHSDYGSSTFQMDATQLLFVPAHKTGEQLFKLLKQLCSLKLLNRIVIDEAQHLLCSKFRQCFDLLKAVNQIRVPIVFLSATLPPTSVPSLIKHMQLKPSTVQTIRAPTYRVEIGYSVITTTTADQMNHSQLQIDALSSTFGYHDRGIVYCYAVDDCKALSEQTGIPYYIGPMDAAEKPVVAQNWRRGQYRWIIATSAFSEGIDYPHVRVVLNLEAPHGLCEYDQMAGRAGRDGLPAKAIILSSTICSVADIEGLDHMGQIGMNRYLTLTNQC